MTAIQSREQEALADLRKDRQLAVDCLSKQPKMSSAEAVANFKRRQAHEQQTRAVG